MSVADRFKAEGASGYEQRIRTLIPAYATMHQMTNALLRALLGSRAEVLVVGSGTGMELCELGAANPHWNLLGVDPSADMLEIAKGNVARLGLTDRVTLRRGKVEDLPGDQRFDAATLALVMHFLPDDGGKLAILGQIAERLKPGAPLILVDLCGDPHAQRGQLLMSAWKENQVLQGVAREEVEERMGERMNVVQYITEERSRMLLHQAGFHLVERFFEALLLTGLVARKR